MHTIKFVISNVFLILLMFYECAGHYCCPPGQALLVRGNTDCWDPNTGYQNVPKLDCNASTIKLPNKYFKVNEKQQLVLNFLDGSGDVFVDKYCLANTTTKNDTSLKNVSVYAVICEDEEEVRIVDDRVLGYCMIASVIFMIPTGLIYAALAELRDVQGKSIICFCLSLGIGQGIMSIMKLMEYSDMSLCATRGFLAYFFFVAAFFWSNAISIQVLLSTKRPSTLDYSWYEFKWYFLYAWGCPIVLTMCMAIVNYHPGHHLRPGIGLNHCWFFDRYQAWYYMYSVISILLAANIAIFTYTSIIIWRLSFSSSHLKALRYKFTMSVRLIILMGLPWVFEMISELAGQHIIWAIVDVFNCLQGVLIFLLLVVFRRRVVKLIYKHGWLNCCSDLVEKHLAVEDDEENVVQHTDVPMNDTTII